MTSETINSDDSNVQGKIYSAIKLRNSIAETVVSVGLLAAWGFSPQAHAVVESIEFAYANVWIRFIFLLIAMGVTFYFAGFVFEVYGSYVIEKDFALSRLSFGGWFYEKLKSDIVGGVFGAIIAFACFFIIRNTGENWWWIFACVLILFSVIIARIAPLVLFPIFYKFTPVTEGEVAARITAQLEKAGIAFSGIYSFDLGRTTRKANAAFTGIGSTRRILLSDTLLSTFTVDEIESVFAHELAHMTKKHILKQSLFSSAALLIVLFVSSIVLHKVLFFAGVESITEIGAFPAVMLVGGVAMFFVMPVMNALSRKHEREADAFAVTSMKSPEAFISAMEKIAQTNLADSTPSPIVEFLFHSHPSIQKRIDAARALAVKAE